MIKKIYIVLLGFVISSFGVQAQMFEFSARDAAKLPNRKLLVVLQEEDPIVLSRIRKDPEKTARYKSIILYSNNLLKKTVSNFWKTGQAVEYLPFKECKKLGESDTCQSYVTLEFTSLRVNENMHLYILKPDTTNVYGLRSELTRRNEFGYFEMKLIEKFRAIAMYTFNISASVPNEFDFIAATQFMSALVKEKLKDPKFSTRDYELKIQQNNAKLSKRLLIVDSNVVNRQHKSFSYIVKEYDSLSVYQLSNPKEIVEKIYVMDTSFAYFCIVPYLDPIARGQSYLGTSGGNLNDYENKVYFMHLIFDIGSGELLYYDKTEENVILVRDWKRFQRYSREKTFTLPSFQKNSNPYPQQQYQPQNQY